MGEAEQTTGLARFVPRIALDWIAEDPTTRWRSVPATMVFADVSGFTALTERLSDHGRIGAEELVEVLSRVFGAMLRVSERRGGQMLKFGGDALLFLFPGDDHVAQACAAAVEMRAELSRAAAVPTSVGSLALSVSTGVHTGDVDLFLVGGEQRELVVLGPATSTTIRCESAADAGQIVVSPQVAGHLPGELLGNRDDGLLLLSDAAASRVPPPVLPVPASPDPDMAARLFPPLLARVLADRRPDPAHRVATIAFLGFDGTDALLERDGPGTVAAHLDATVRTVQDAFATEDVALLAVDCDVDGGKFFAAAGVPLTSEDDEGRMLRALAAIDAAGPPLPLHAGVNRGHVFAAEVGNPDRAAFSAMGDTTNTAARISAKAPAGSVYAHPTVLEHARAHWEATPVGPFSFKGKAEPQLLHEVGEELGARERTTDDDVPFAGRGDLLASVRDHLAAGAPALVVHGAVGVGKSRLVEQALATLDDDVTVLRLHAEPYGASTSYRVLRDRVRDLLGIERGLPQDMTRQLLDGVRRLVPAAEPWAALLGDVTQVPVDPSEEVVALLARYRPSRTADVVVELLDAVVPGALAVVVDDAHWADDASAAVLRAVAVAARSRPWSVVVVRRDDEGGVELDMAEVVAVAPLPEQDLRELVLSLTDAAPLRPHELEQVVERAGGNPLFATELVRAVRELGSLDAVPTSLQGAMAAQVDALDPVARRALSYASVLGRSFRRQVLNEVLDAEQLVLDDSTTERLEQFLELDGEQRLRFRVGLLRDVTYDGLGFRLRARLHQEAGEAIERIASDVDAEAETLSLHFAASEDHERALRYALVAANRAERAHAVSEAAVQLERAIEASRALPGHDDADRRGLLMRLGDMRDLAGLLPGALEAYDAATRLTDDPLVRADLALRRAGVRVSAGSFGEALREVDTVRSHLAERNEIEARQLRAQASALAAVVAQRQERPFDAFELASNAAAEATRCYEQRALARAHGVLAWAGLVQGRDGAQEHAERALELFEEVGDLVGQAHMANNLGGHALFRGDWDATLRWYSRAEEACRRQGAVADAALTAANTGEVLVNQGRLDEAAPLLEDAARVLRASGHVWGAAFVDLHLGRLFHARGDLAQAEALLRGCRDENSRLGRPTSAYEAALHLAECLVTAGSPAEALECIAEAAGAVQDAPTGQAPARALAEGRALAALGRTEEAQECIAAGVAAAREDGLNYDLARLLSLTRDLSGGGAPRRGLLDDDAFEVEAEIDVLLWRLGIRSLPAQNNVDSSAGP